MFSKDLLGKFPEFKEVPKAMMIYDLKKQRVEILPTIVVPSGPTILSVSTTIPANQAKTKCGL